MNLRNQRRIAASILKVGVNRVWLDPDETETIQETLTREGIRELIADNIIKARPKQGVSRVRARKLHAARAYGHRKGHGSRKGAKKARTPRKEAWMKKIRAQRRKLRELRDSGEIDPSTYRRLYRKAKGGEYRSVAHLEAHIKSKKE